MAHNGLTGSTNIPVVIFPVPTCTTEIDILESWSKPYIVSLACEVRTINIREDQMETPEIT